jgi:GNAT superfamily N-acetyltransferase
MTGVRPLRPEDVDAGEEVGWTALWTLAVEHEPGLTIPERTPDLLQRSRLRIAHLQRTDPDGAWVATHDDTVVGLALSLRRGPMWFLSLLAVSTELQAKGIGKALLEASLQTAEGAGAAWLLATVDPKAIRRYALAGFALHPSYTAKGPLDRSLLPGTPAVRDGDWGRDGGMVDVVVARLRGAPYGPDLDPMAATCTLLVAEDGADRGFAVLRASTISSLGATSPALAQQLLWASLAAAEKPEVTVDWLFADQQWAIDVAIAARLPLGAGSSRCIRSTLGPLTPYLPGGAYG